MTGAAENGAAGGERLTTRFGQGWALGLPADNARLIVEDWLARAEAGDGVTVHRARNRVVRLAPSACWPAGPEVAVKLFAVPSGLRRLQSMVRLSKARKSFLAAAALARHGVDTPAPLASIERRQRRALGRSALVTAWREGTEELRRVFRRQHPAWPDGPDHRFAALLGRFVRSVHEAGVIHRDLSDGNILVQGGPETAHFLLIDLNRCRLVDRPGRLARIRDAVRIGIAPELQPAFLAACLDEEPLSSSSWLLYRTMKRTFVSWLAVKRALRLRQIARRLKL